jgi:hypothetical protein
MRYAILVIAAAIATFGAVNVLAANNMEQESLVSCRRSKDKPPVNSASDRSGA